MVLFEDRNREVISYFKSEYKNDWEQAYTAYLDEKRTKKGNLFKTIFTTLFHTHNKGE